MRYKLKLLLVALALFGLVLAQVAVAGTIVDNVRKTLYVDGQKVDVGFGPQVLSFPYCCITIGCEGNVNYRYNGYKGLIDEFAIYEGLAEDRIALHASAPDEATYVSRVLADSPKLYFRFEDTNEVNGAPVDNSGTVDINGTYYGSAGYIVAGKFGNAANFDPSDDVCDCIDVWDANGDFSFDLGGANGPDVAIEMWVKTDQNDGTSPRLFQHNGDSAEMGGYGAMFMANSVGLIGGGNTDYVTQNIHTNTWRHIVITYDSKTIEVGALGSYYDEVMDDDPCLYIPFDGYLSVAGDPNYRLKDYSNRNCYVVCGPEALVETTPGSLGKAVYFNNADAPSYSRMGWVAASNTDWQTPPSPPYSDNYLDHKYAFTVTNGTGVASDVTFELWFKCDALDDIYSVQSYTTLFNQSAMQAGAEKYPPAIGRAKGNEQFRVLSYGKPLTWWVYSDWNTWPTDEWWHHLVVVYNEDFDGDNDTSEANDLGITVYLDGDPILESNGSRKGFVGPESKFLVIGNISYPSPERDRIMDGLNPYTGYVDEFAVYKGMLSPERVAAHYVAWQPRDCEEMREREFPFLDYDSNHDCMIDLYDFADFALSWRKCNDPLASDAECPPNW